MIVRRVRVVSLHEHFFAKSTAYTARVELDESRLTFDVGISKEEYEALRPLGRSPLVLQISKETTP
jgi:hypothetical protein